MKKSRPIHPHFLFYLTYKEQKLINLYKSLREFILEIYPDANEIVYHTHALTSVYSISEKLADAFCMIPIYNNHMNLGFNKGTLLNDPHKLLTGTGNFIRHIPVINTGDFNNQKVKDLVNASVDFAIKDTDKPIKSKGLTFLKIKNK